MDLSTYQALRAEFDRERVEALNTAARLTQQIKDLDRAWKKLGGKAVDSSSPGGAVLRNGSLASKVCAAVEALPETFESPEVWRAVLAANPGVVHDSHGFRANVANALKSLVGSKLELLVPGAGNRPARFRRLQATQAQGGEAVSA